MHFLGHLVAAHKDPYAEIGQIAGDFVRKKNSIYLDDRIAKGYARHIEIDAFTDKHPAVRQSKIILDGPFRRYAGLTLDLYFDHLLARHFHNYSGEDFFDVVVAINERLITYQDAWPDEMRNFTRYFIENDILRGLYNRDAMYSGMQRITYRLNRDIELHALVDQVFEKEKELRPLFDEFIEDFHVRFWNED